MNTPHQRRSPVAAIVAAVVILVILAGLVTWREDEAFVKVLLWIGIPLGAWSVTAILTLDEDKEPAEH